MSTTPETPEYEYEPWGKYLLRTVKNVVKLVAGIVAFVIVITIAGVGYEQLDENGYISHERTLDVFMTNNWLVGENRVCWLNPVLDANYKPTGKYANLECPHELQKVEPHNLPVTFKGVLDVKDFDGKDRTISYQWTCTRGSDGFVCSPMATH